MAIEDRLETRAVGIEHTGGDADLIETIAVCFDQIEDRAAGSRQFFFCPDHTPHGEFDGRGGHD